MQLARACQLPAPGEASFYLWGARQTGKTTLLKAQFPPDRHHWVNLLDEDLFWELSDRPSRLRHTLARQNLPAGSHIVIDEIQRVPRLLAEVHLMIEEYGWKFALCGSSNRKIVRGNYHLPGGRAHPCYLKGLTAYELHERFDLGRMLNHGYLPAAYLSDNPGKFMEGYVDEFMRHEIEKEAVVKKLPEFRKFLDVAALHDGRSLNYSNIARECGVDSKTVKEYYKLLELSFNGYWVASYRKNPKSRKEIAPRFYFADVALANYLVRRTTQTAPGTPEFGKSFENWVAHEISTYLKYKHANIWDLRLSYWNHHGNGAEVDFLIGDKVAIEAKSSENITDKHLRGLRKLVQYHPSFDTRILVARCRIPDQTDDGILILPPEEFVQMLWQDEFAIV